MRALLLVVLTTAALVFAAGCGTEDSVEATEPVGPPPTVPADAVDLTGQASVEVAVGDNNFEPQVIAVSAGTEIVWTNTGRNRHNVISSDDAPAFEQIETDVLDDGGSGSRIFDDAGAYPYYCSIHGSPNRGQRGSIVVLPTE